MADPENRSAHQPNDLDEQIAAVEKHLAWLKKKRTQEEPKKGKEASKITPPEIDTEASGSASPGVEDPSQEQLIKEANLWLRPEDSAASIQQAKIGCLLVFSIATLLALFTLFGLPYLINSNPSNPSDPPDSFDLSDPSDPKVSGSAPAATSELEHPSDKGSD